MSDIAILLLAAGASRRMRGTDKLLEDVDGLPVLRRQAKVALETDAHVIVTLPPDCLDRVRVLEDLRVQRVIVEKASEGMGVSIGAAVAALPSSIRAVAVLPADMPEIVTEDLSAVIAASIAHPDCVVRGMSASGIPGHPVVFPSRLFPMLVGLSGDEGARSILSGEEVHLVPLPELHAVTDLDTPEAWEVWRAQRKP